MHDIMLRLQAALARQPVDLVRYLNPPATPEQIAAAEAAMGVRLPEDVCRAYLMHDGQDPEGVGLVEICEWLSLERMVQEWTVWNELLVNGSFNDIRSAGVDHAVRSDWWNPKWIPFTYDGSGNHYCIDLDPAEQGQSGQIITMWHDSAERDCVAANFAGFMDEVAARLESGDVAWSNEDESLVERIERGT